MIDQTPSACVVELPSHHPGLISRAGCSLRCLNPPTLKWDGSQHSIVACGYHAFTSTFRPLQACRRARVSRAPRSSCQHCQLVGPRGTRRYMAIWSTTSHSHTDVRIPQAYLEDFGPNVSALTNSQRPGDRRRCHGATVSVIGHRGGCGAVPQGLFWVGHQADSVREAQAAAADTAESSWRRVSRCRPTGVEAPLTRCA